MGLLDDGAIVADKASGAISIRTRCARWITRAFFQVKGAQHGALPARASGDHPAGGSPSGLELAARTADVVFSVVQDLAAARLAYADLKGRMAKYGRSPDDLAVLPGVMPIIGATDAAAREQLAKLQSWLTPTNAATLVTSRIGYDVSGYPLDGRCRRRRHRRAAGLFHVLYETRGARRYLARSL